MLLSSIHAMTFRISTLLTLTAVIAAYCGSVAMYGVPVQFRGPQVIDAVVLLAFVTAEGWFRHRALLTARKLLWIAAGASWLICGAAVLVDSSLPTMAVKMETLWATGVLAMLAGVLASLLYLWLKLHKHSRLALAVSLMLLGASGFMCVRACDWGGRPDDEFRFGKRPPRVMIRLRRMREYLGSGGEFVLGMSHMAHIDRVNYLRKGSGHLYWTGARIRVAGFGLAYVHSSKSEDDLFISPIIAVLVPYWLMIATSGLGVFIGARRLFRERKE